MLPHLFCLFAWKDLVHDQEYIRNKLTIVNPCWLSETAWILQTKYQISQDLFLFIIFWL